MMIDALAESVQDGRLIMDGGIVMELKKIMNRIKPPCPKCPYKLGLVKTEEYQGKGRKEKHQKFYVLERKIQL